MFKSDKKNVKLDKYEIGIIINSLVEFRNKLIKEERTIDPVDELIIKFVDLNGGKA